MQVNDVTGSVFRYPLGGFVGALIYNDASTVAWSDLATVRVPEVASNVLDVSALCLN